MGERDAVLLERRRIQYLLNAAYEEQGLAAAARFLVSHLTDEQRIDVFGSYCRHCGTPDAPCQCMNDE